MLLFPNSLIGMIILGTAAYMVKSSQLSFSYVQAEDQTYTPVLIDINIKIKAGEFVAILGHNGSGKSTLARHLNALLTPQKGTLWIKGLDSSKPENVWDIRQTTGMVFQNPDNQLIATIVEEDVAFGPENLGVAPVEIRKRVDNSLENVGMKGFASFAPHNLSGGQKQRVAIAGVLAMMPDCIVLDEPTAMLDPSGRREVIETIKRLNRDDGITVILITHFMEEAAQANRVLVMDKGSVVMDDAPRVIFNRVDELRALRLDVPHITALAHLLRKKGIPVSECVLTVEDFINDEAIKQKFNLRRTHATNS
jgi:energy-coupling factor transport system ATP-binding protein